MVFEIKRDIFCHHLTNPPAYDRISDINLDVTDFGLVEFTKKEATSSEAAYSIKIPDAESIGFISQEEPILNKEFDNFMLAFNLVLQTVCVTAKSSSFSTLNMKYPPPMQSSHMETKVSKTSANVQEHIRFQEKVNIRFIHSVSVDGRAILEVFRKLQNVHRFEININSSEYEQNLKDSFENYEEAMVDSNLIFKFKFLFTSLEKVTNINGTQREKDDFDIEVGRLYAGIHTSEAQDWRSFYNRIKHIQRNSKDINTYYKGQQTLPQKLPAIRNCVRSILLSKLK